MKEDSLRQRMEEVISLITSDIASIRTGKATPALVEAIDVKVYQGQQKLKVNELATISVQDANTILIDPWDKSIIGEIRKGIEEASVGLSPNITGELIRVSLPPFTTEDREKYVKLLSTKAENGRIMVRQIRGDYLKDIRHLFDSKEITEDEKFQQEKRLQEITDEYIAKIDSLASSKKEEIMTI